MTLPRDAGLWFRLLALLHGAVGLAMYHEPLLGTLQAGLWNSVDGDAPREAAFWFMMFTPMLFLTGSLATQARERTGAYPPALIGALLGVCLTGTVLMPISGFPLGVLVCLLAWRDSKKDRERTLPLRSPSAT